MASERDYEFDSSGCKYDKQQGGNRMNNLVELKNEQVVTTSLQVAKDFGKRHDHVLRDITKITDPNSGLSEDFIRNNFKSSSYKDSTGRLLPCYFIARDGFSILVMRYSGKKAMEFKELYIRRFNAMEKQIYALDLEDNQSFIDLKQKVDNLFDNLTIDYQEQRQLQDLRRIVVVNALGGYESNAYAQMGKRVFAACASDFKKQFNIPRYNELRKIDFKKGLKYLGAWQPNKHLKLDIQQANNQITLGERWGKVIPSPKSTF